jgi:hypothetical protein
MPDFKPRRLFMLCSRRHLVRQTARYASILPIAALLGTLSGCQGIVSSPTLSQIRIIDASPDAPGLDVYEGTAAVAYNLGFGTITSYLPINPGTYTFSTKSAGTSQVLSSAKATLVSNGQYTILVGDSSASLQELILKDQSQAAPSGQISLRFINQATRLSPLDIYLIPAGQKLTAVTPLVTNISFSVNTGYLNIPTGTYTIVMVPTGTIPTSTTVATYTGAPVTYSSGSARTVILIDQQLGSIDI